MIETYEDALAFIHGRSKWKKTLSMQRIEALLAKIGNPQLNNRYLHITGTNGKGSVSKMSAALLRAKGLKVGLFTSPYIMNFNERIQDDDGPISDRALLKLVQYIAPIVAELDKTSHPGGPTEFELVTVLMFLYFANHPVDVIVLEVGIGGEWDSTNVISQTLVSVITTIGLDHMATLGSTLANITAQKMGILKPQVPLVVGRIGPAELKLIEARAACLNLPVLELGRDFVTSAQSTDLAWGQTFNYEGDQNYYEAIPLNLMGDYQLDNVGVAVTASNLVLRQLSDSVLTQDQVKQALAKVEWPVRFEKISEHPTVILDGAHNEAGISALSQTILTHLSDKKVQLIFAALDDKNYTDMLIDLAQLKNVTVHLVNFIAPSGRHAIQPKQVVALLNRTDITYHENWQLIYNELVEVNSVDTVILFTGSLYFVSEVRQMLKSGKRLE